MEIIARHAVVRGHVQGVAFRHHTKLEARALGLVGYVRNLADGSVEVWCEGPVERVDALVDWLRRGPPAARVRAVESSVAVPEQHTCFQVRFD